MKCKECGTDRRILDALPEMAFIENARGIYTGPDGTPPVIAVKRGEMGYHPIYTRATADDLNAGRGVTPAQREAMLAGSMFGWHVPAADPSRYDANGRPS